MFIWGKAMSSSYGKADKQLGVLDVRSRSLTLKRKPIAHEELISSAIRQQIRYQRSIPVLGGSVPDSEECDNWQEEFRQREKPHPVLDPRTGRPHSFEG
jgi:hypothetical protein